LSRRLPLAVLAASTALALAISPSLAAAQTTTAPHVIKYAGKIAPAPSVRHSSVSPETSSGLTAALVSSTTGARSFSFDATGSTDSSSTITGYTFDYGDGSSTVTNTTGTSSYTYTRAGTYTITVTVTDAAGNTATDSLSVTTLGSDYTPYGPTRILDTRSGTGEGGTAAAIAADSAIKLEVGGNGSIPTDATAVVITLTATEGSDGGYIVAYPDGVTKPGTSTLNFAADQTIAATVTVAIGSDGYIDLYNDSGSTTELIGDVSGYYTQTSASGFTPLTPARILDTRTTTGGHDSPIDSDSTLTLTVAGADGGDLPSSGITAVALNLTATDETSSGNLNIYADGSSKPTSSILNYSKDVNIANYAVVPVGSDGKIDVYNSSAGTINLIGDVSGYFSSDGTSSFVPVTPTRSLDTRTLAGGTVCADCAAQDPTLTSIANDATAYAVTATVADTASSGDLIIYPAGAPKPSVSNINWSTGEAIANSTYIAPSSTGIYFYNQSSGTMNVIVDEYGYFAAE
jgi:PKD repeat protein